MTTAKHLVRLVTLLAALPVLIASGPGAAGADMRIVNCGGARRLANALRLPAGRQLTIVIQGACTENLVITRDDVTLQGQAGASIAPTDATRATIQIDGARRVRIENLTVTGGEGAVVGTRGAGFELANVTATGGTRFGVVASFNSVASVDGSTVQNVAGDGVVVVNNASLVITNSTVQTNTGNGLVAARGGYLRVGQDRTGSNVVKPVTVSGNGATGIVATENASVNVAGGSSSGNTGSGIFVGRGSGGSIGAGISGLFSPTAVQGNGRDGITVEGGNATILGGPIGGTTAPAGNGRAGIQVTNAGSARIGIKNDNSAYVPLTISNNGSVGIQVSIGGAAFIGGTTVSANGTDPNGTFGQAGVNVVQATVTLAGDNVIQNNPDAGVFAGRGASVRIGDGAFGLSTANTISGNGGGASASNRAGIFAFQGGVIETRGATITGNTGVGARAFMDGIIDVRAGTLIEGTVAAPSTSYSSTSFTEAGHGVVAGLRSTIRLRDQGTLVRNNTGDGVIVFTGSAVEFRNPSTGQNPVAVTGNGGFGLQCFGAEASHTGTTTGIAAAPPAPDANALGAISTNCTGF